MAVGGYGGVIPLEAARPEPHVLGVIAIAPGHGAPGLPQIAAWHGGCRVGFPDPERAPPRQARGARLNIARTSAGLNAPSAAPAMP